MIRGEVVTGEMLGCLNELCCGHVVIQRLDALIVYTSIRNALMCRGNNLLA